MRQSVGHAQTLGFGAEAEHKRFLHSLHLTHSCYFTQLFLYVQIHQTHFKEMLVLVCAMHAVMTYISVCGEGHTDFHVCVGPQSARGWSKAGTA